MKPIPPNRRWHPFQPPIDTEELEDLGDYSDLLEAILNEEPNTDTIPQGGSRDALLTAEEALLNAILGERSIPVADAPAEIPAPDCPPGAIRARYNGICGACRRPVLIGQWIAPHPAGRWVHAECFDLPVENLIAPIRPHTLLARYPGYCRLCRTPYPEGTPITHLPTYGWVHVECAERDDSAGELALVSR